jgi:hypothetical protein
MERRRSCVDVRTLNAGNAESRTRGESVDARSELHCHGEGVTQSTRGAPRDTHQRGKCGVARRRRPER